VRRPGQYGECDWAGQLNRAPASLELVPEVINDYGDTGLRFGGTLSG
jgi:hypothetical protein